jgi:hypothetical protein
VAEQRLQLQLVHHLELLALVAEQEPQLCLEIQVAVLVAVVEQVKLLVH